MAARAGKSRVLFSGRFHDVPGYSHAMTADGRRHLLLMSPSHETARRIEIVLGWATALRQATARAP